MADKAASCKDGGSYGRPFLVPLVSVTFWILRNRTEFQNRCFPHLCIFKVEKLFIVSIDGWHISEYNFVINNYVLPKDISEKTDEKYIWALS